MSSGYVLDFNTGMLKKKSRKSFVVKLPAERTGKALGLPRYTTNAFPVPHKEFLKDFLLVGHLRKWHSR